MDTLDKVTSYLLQEHYQNNGYGSIFPYLSDYATSEETSAALSKTFTTATRKLFYLFFPPWKACISTPMMVIPLSSTAGLHPVNRRPLSDRGPLAGACHRPERQAYAAGIGSDPPLTSINPRGDPSGRTSRHYLYGTRSSSTFAAPLPLLCLVVAQLDINDLQSSFNLPAFVQRPVLRPLR